MDRADHRPAASSTAVWEWQRSARRLTPVDRSGAVRGLPVRDSTLDEWLARVHPADREQVGLAFDIAARDPSPLDVAFRVAGEGDATVWLHAQDLHADRHLDRDRTSPILLRDVTEAKGEAARFDHLFSELAHRTRNLFGLVAALARISARGADTPAEMAEALGERLAALERVHALVDPTRDRVADRAVTLDALLETLLAPYRGAGPTDRISISIAPTGPIEIGPGARSAFALVIHELATHAARHGALAEAEGRLALTARAEPDGLLLAWSEHLPLSPRLPPEADPSGPLSMAETMTRLLSGTIRLDRRHNGLVATLAVPTARLHV